MPYALVPAAGASRRMGRPKLLLPVKETTVVGATVAALLAGGAAGSPSEVCLVIRPEDGPLHRWGAEQGLRLAENPAPERGMLSSILTGLEALGGAEGLAEGGEPLVVCPADLPGLTASTVAAVLDRLARGAALAVPVHGGRRGHPLGIAASRIPELPGLDPAVGLHQLLTAHPDEVAEVEVADPGCLRDVDTPEDYEGLKA